MVRMFMIICSLCFSYISFAWSPQGNKIKTRWAEQVTVENVWQIYPRPQLKRVNWKNLNGLWKYQVTEMNRKKKDVHYGDEILVPFSIESSLSGVEGQFGPSDKLWYRKEFTIDPDWKGKQILLHFGAVDYECQVWVNNILVGKHTGGNNPFSFNITRFLKKDGKQVVELSVTGSYGYGIHYPGETAAQPAGYLVYSCFRYLADCLDRTGESCLYSADVPRNQY